MKSEVVKKTQQIVLEGQLSAKILAKEIGKPYSTLLREINPFDMQAKLGVETLLDIMRVTQNVDPLRIMAEALGYELVGVCAPSARPEPVKLRRREAVEQRQPVFN